MLYLIPCHAHSAIPYTMPWTPGHAINHAMFARPYHVPVHDIYHAIPCQTIPYTMLCPPGHTIYFDMPTSPYHILCKARQAIPYTLPCIVKPYHILCNARQTLPFSMSCAPDHTIYHTMPIRSYHILCYAHQAIPYIMPCLPYNTIYHAIHRQAITYTLPCPQAITYTLPCPPDLITMPCHFGKSWHLS